ncbi:Lachesin [Frankliniella fusca]|uniref:Lachesin n=1 Tax=Frankliniella fusca TaxID=407009 RepID=A0AAE1HKV7_9NEOP|nr:Lachesin [Frankliniella fusca]
MCITLDNRNGDLERAEHGAISRPKAAKGRYFFLTSASGVPLPPSGPRASPHNWEADDALVPTEMARLRILNVSEEDAGVFRCRVDFLNSPTTNFRVNLTLATPPSAPVISDASGVEVGAVAGPFQEGYDLQLSCSVSGGHPRPVVTWWMGDTLLDDAVETKSSSEVINRLRVQSVTREHHNAVLQCRAAPLPGAPAQRRDVQLDVYREYLPHLNAYDALGFRFAPFRF